MILPKNNIFSNQRVILPILENTKNIIGFKLIPTQDTEFYISNVKKRIEYKKQSNIKTIKVKLKQAKLLFQIQEILISLKKISSCYKNIDQIDFVWLGQIYKQNINQLTVYSNEKLIHQSFLNKWVIFSSIKYEFPYVSVNLIKDQICITNCCKQLLYRFVFEKGRELLPDCLKGL